MDAQQELLLVGLVLDRIGVPPSDQLRDRLQFLQGAVLGFQLFGSRWVAGEAREERRRGGGSAPVGGPGVELSVVPAEGTAQPVATVASELGSTPGATPVEEEETARAQQVADLREDRDAVLEQPETTTNAEPPLDWDEPPSGAESPAPTPPAAEPVDTTGHHPSWREEITRKTFFAAITDAGVSEHYDVIAAYCESRGFPRPSAMDPDARAAFLGRMTTDKAARDRLIEWCSIHGGDVAAEIKAKKSAAAAERKAKKAAALRAGQRQ